LPLKPLKILCYNVTATIETRSSEIGRRSGLRVVIGEPLKCLVLYHPTPRVYLREVHQDSSRHGSLANARPEDLTADPIHLHRRSTGQLREIPSAPRPVVMTLGAIPGEALRRRFSPSTR